MGGAPPSGGSTHQDGGNPGSGGAPGSGGSSVGGADASLPDAAPGAGGAPPCTSDVPWYQDDDMDGYGTSVSVVGCPAPTVGRWALASNDCDDTNRLVHPGQLQYFGMPYKKPDATDSFDYDCSGVEEPDPHLTLAPEDCGLLKLALCGTASGYTMNTRSGPGINPWCGSTTVRSCIPSTLVCMVSYQMDQTPFGCR